MILFMCLLIGVGVAIANPVGQPLYSSQYVGAQNIPASAQYRTQAQAYESTKIQTAPQQYSSRPLLLSPNVDKQLQKVAAFGGPLYLQQIQSAQQQSSHGETSQESIYSPQRKATTQQIPARQVQSNYIPGQQQTQRYSKPVAQQGYRKKVQQEEQQQQLELEPEQEPEDYDPNPSYQFGFDVKDDLYTNYQNRKETKDGNKITGSYSVVDSDGYIRTVTYTADPKEGFKAEVTRQKTDIVVKIPKQRDPQFERHQPQQQYVQAPPQERRVPQQHQQYQPRQQQQQQYHQQREQQQYQPREQQREQQQTEKQNLVYQYE